MNENCFAPSFARPCTGTGKTATFAISILQQLETANTNCQALVLAPTRELAQQIVKVPLRDLSHKTLFFILTHVRNVCVGDQVPGRLLEDTCARLCGWHCRTGGHQYSHERRTRRSRYVRHAKHTTCIRTTPEICECFFFFFFSQERPAACTT
jgi:hypothetical protein